MTVLANPHVGRLWAPELDRTVLLPGSTSMRQTHYMGMVSYEVRDRHGRKTQAGYGAGVVATEGLLTRWRESDELQQRFREPMALVNALCHKLDHALRYPAAVVHNERVNNGGNMVSKSFWGSTATPTNATVNAPTRIALASLNTFAAAAGDQSIGSASANVTTNEWTTNGLARTGALTPGGLVAPSALDGQFTLTLSNTFTCATAASTAYGGALFDNTTAASNLYCEATFAAAALQIADTVNVTWTVKD